jgi:SAM-dependent methyltransferase
METDGWHSCLAQAPNDYDRGRPSYPAALVERIVAASPGPGVLDAGCGAGIAARQFQAAGCRVLGVDPDARMAALARQSGVEGCPGGKLAIGSGAIAAARTMGARCCRSGSWRRSGRR